MSRERPRRDAFLCVTNRTKEKLRSGTRSPQPPGLEEDPLYNKGTMGVGRKPLCSYNRLIWVDKPKL